MIKNNLVFSLKLLIAASLSFSLKASTFDFSFAGPGVNGTVELTYGTATDSKYAQALEVTGITGSFSDLNNGLAIVDAPVVALEPLNRSTPEPTNLLAPDDFSRFAVAAGLPAQSNGFVTYDNLFYPGGSPQTGSDYPASGGFSDVYGLLFNIGGSTVVDFWSNGDLSGTGAGPIDYGVAVATPDTALDYVSGGVSITPEPSALGLLSVGLIGMLVRRSQK